MSDVERVAEIVYQAMRWAIKHPHVTGDTPPWVPNGNSQAQDRAREAARAALSAARPHEWNERLDLGNGFMLRVGGRWHGWLFKRHPDGQFVSVRRLDVLPNNDGDDPLVNNLRRPAGEEG